MEQTDCSDAWIPFFSSHCSSSLLHSSLLPFPPHLTSPLFSPSLPSSPLFHPSLPSSPHLTSPLLSSPFLSSHAVAHLIFPLYPLDSAVLQHHCASLARNASCLLLLPPLLRGDFQQNAGLALWSAGDVALCELSVRPFFFFKFFFFVCFCPPSLWETNSQTG